MSAQIDKAISKLLNNLLTTNRDAAEGYISACDNVKDIELKRTFLDYAQKRENFVQELKTEIDALGGAYEDKSSILAVAHRIWIGIKGSLTGSDIPSIVKECLRGEEASLADYDLASANAYIAESTKGLIERHRQTIQESISTLKKLMIEKEKEAQAEARAMAEKREQERREAEARAREREEERKRKAEEEARRAEAERKRKAEEEARKAAEQQAKARAEAEAQARENQENKDSENKDQ